MIADDLLLGNKAAGAQRRAATEIFQLAHQGYLTLKPNADGVEITRTHKPTDASIYLEQRLLLSAVSPRITLSTPQQLPVAQTLTATLPISASARTSLLDVRAILLPLFIIWVIICLLLQKRKEVAACASAVHRLSVFVRLRVA